MKAEQYIFGTHILSDITPKEGGSDYWRALFYFNLYRMILAVFFVTSSIASFSVGSLGSRHPELFTLSSFSYAFLSLLFAYLIHRGHPRYITQCRINILTDILIIILLYHASGGRGAGLEIILFVTVSASGILLGGRGALAAASLATIALILEHFYQIATDQRSLGGFTTLGFLGGGLFVTAFIIYYLSRLLRKTEVEVAQQNLDLQKLSHINELIVEQLHSGVIVVDRFLRPILINQSGRKLLDMPATSALPPTLQGLMPEISLDYNQLEGDTDGIETKIELTSGKKILTRYKALGESYENGYMVLLDDYSQIEREQRNEKFISMGRLSASIAHEIRNPLGAISHAGQLLAESPAVMQDDSRLVEIIEHQSQRINQIIKTILELGQTNEQNFETFILHDWLEKIIHDFRAENELPNDAIQLTGNKSITACGDAEQLQHVVVNLLSNSLRYADHKNRPFIMLNIQEITKDGFIPVTVTDNGPGISKDNLEKLFEPFFTTSSTGNGLGLYISRKICLSNYGYLDYMHHSNDRGYFMLTLAGDDHCQHQLARKAD